MQGANPAQNDSDEEVLFVDDEEARVRLRWQDVTTKELRAPLLKTPISLGRDFANMPGKLNGRRLSKVVFESNMVSRYHALIDWVDNQVIVTDQGSANGTYVNGQLTSQAPLQTGDTIKIGPYMVTVRIEAVPQAVVTNARDTVLSMSRDDDPDSDGEHTRFLAAPDFQPEVSAVFDLAQGYQALQHDIRELEEKLHVLERLHKQSATFQEEQEEILELKFSQLEEKISQGSPFSGSITETQDHDVSDQQKEMFKKILGLVGMQIEDVQDLAESRYQRQENTIRELQRDLDKTNRFGLLAAAGLLIAFLVTAFVFMSR
jgi:pSer/pThr/pTyr-binding forkhead associated (FHA) protein